MPGFQEMSPDQRRILVNAQQAYSAYRDVLSALDQYRGGMHWKTAKGRQYLFRSRPGSSKGQVVGPRNPHTEAILADFRTSRLKAQKRRDGLRDKLRDNARYVRAAHLGRMDRVSAGILRVLDRGGWLDSGIWVVGSNAMYAYEAASGVILGNDVLQTEDLDLLFDARKSLTLAARKGPGLLASLRKVDKSFDAIQAGHFRATNDQGFMVDLIKPLPRPPGKIERRKPDVDGGSDRDWLAAEIEGLDLLFNGPAFDQIVMASDGMGVRMRVPDPRFFAAHKLYVSGRPDRSPLKSRKDRVQAEAVVQMVREHLPDLSLEAPETKAIPKSLRDAMAAIPDTAVDWSGKPGL